MAKFDIKSGGIDLYPEMKESSELRWTFIRKVYVILMLLSAFYLGVTAVVSFVDLITNPDHPLDFFFVFVVLHILR
ncbi:hypothetical protein ARALYDRAFT_915372 [Arabidopsis lyrata subsp. lyrata]|uniref:Uncharacterized protein n=1 Tax=Arabidopsis lyrata subsp. lyrata TaxID=81972 RepID=D7MGW9_ARALL|nr:hypothetical protein ARALYDRAFT_915372 [Arabidopsis lyrata subsp. lyrata]